MRNIISILSIGIACGVAAICTYSALNKSSNNEPPIAQNETVDFSPDNQLIAGGEHGGGHGGGHHGGGHHGGNHGGHRGGNHGGNHGGHHGGNHGNHQNGHHGDHHDGHHGWNHDGHHGWDHHGFNHHWNHDHHDNWWHHDAHPGWDHHHWNHWNSWHHPWHDWYWYNGWNGNPGYFADPNWYYLDDGIPSVEYEYDEAAPAGSTNIINNNSIYQQQEAQVTPQSKEYFDDSNYENTESKNQDEESITIDNKQTQGDSDSGASIDLKTTP